MVRYSYLGIGAFGLGHYSFDADFSYLPQEGIGLIVYDNKTIRSTSATIGFRRIGDTKVREANLSLYDRWPDDRTVIAAVQCGYPEP